MSADYLRHLHQGGRLRVTLANGVTGAVYVDPDYYPDEPMYMFYSDWAGCYEAICAVGDAYLMVDFLLGAEVVLTDSIYAQEES